MKLYEEFVALLPAVGPSADLLKDHDFAGTMRNDGLHAITTFVNRFDNAEHEFLSPQIEAGKKNLLLLAGDFLSKVALYTVPKSPGFLTVYPKDVDPEVFVPEYIKVEVAELNQAASALHAAHQAFIRNARANL